MSFRQFGFGDPMISVNPPAKPGRNTHGAVEVVRRYYHLPDPIRLESDLHCGFP
jgi:hypothetical protein